MANRIRQLSNFDPNIMYSATIDFLTTILLIFQTKIIRSQESNPGLVFQSHLALFSDIVLFAKRGGP